MSRVVVPLVLLALFAGGGYFAWTRLKDGRPVKPPPPAAPSAPGLAESERRTLELASDLEAAILFREAIARASSAAVRDELKELYARRAAQVAGVLERELEELRTAHRYAEAAAVAARYASAWAATSAAARADGLVAEFRDEQQAQIERRADEAMALVDEGRYDGAREALRTSWQLEPAYVTALAEKAQQLERTIRVREHEASKGPGAVVSSKPPERARGLPPTPPPLPGAPHADVKRLAEARDLLATARRAFNERRHAQASKAVSDVIGFYGDLRYVSRRQEAITALGLLARHAASGVSGLFRATEVKRDGARMRLRYTFEKEEELLDWEELQPVPHAAGGSFRRIADGVRGEGVMAFLLRASFENDVSVRCIARSRTLRSHGLAFSQDGLETRFLLWMVANTFFVEGENYVKERPGHSILMFGKGVNNDVPVDSPEIGFIFRGDSITEPALVAGEEAILGFAARNDQMSGEVLFKGDRGGRSGSTLGDDGRGIERLRPGLIVFDSTVVFRDVLVEGKLHPEFERTRRGALLDAVAALDVE